MFPLDQKLIKILENLKEAVLINNSRKITMYKNKIKDDFQKFEVSIGEEYNKAVAIDAAGRRLESVTNWVEKNIEKGDRDMFIPSLLAS
jgi:prefoldin subunit 5